MEDWKRVAIVRGLMRVLISFRLVMIQNVRRPKVRSLLRNQIEVVGLRLRKLLAVRLAVRRTRARVRENLDLRRVLE